MTLAFHPGRFGVAADPAAGRWISRLRAVTRLRYQLLGALVVGVVFPAWFNAGFDVGSPLAGSTAPNTLVGTLGAILIGFLVLYRMTAYPGVGALAFVLPSFAFGYLCAVVVFFAARFDYSRLQFLVSFAFVTAWFFVSVGVRRRARPPRLFLLPFGNGARLSELEGAQWLMPAIDAQMELPLGHAPPDAKGTGPRAGDHVATLPDNVNGVVADLRADIPVEWEQFLARCVLSGVPVYHSKQIQESLTGRVEIDHLSENTLGSLIPSSIYFRFKRAVDLGLAILAAPMALIVGVFAAVAIKLDDGGPIFFSQSRIGFRGRPFTIFKFRTMRADAGQGERFTLANDERITRVGRYLRLYHIDELPQILNILTGDMSWIGPRPEAAELAQWYESKIPFYSYRHIVRPGITGWAAVNQGNVAEIEAATSKLQYDFFYIKNFSPWLDLMISARTIRIVATGFGSR